MNEEIKISLKNSKLSCNKSVYLRFIDYIVPQYIEEINNKTVTISLQFGYK